MKTQLQTPLVEWIIKSRIPETTVADLQFSIGQMVADSIVFGRVPISSAKAIVAKYWIVSSFTITDRIALSSPLIRPPSSKLVLDVFHELIGLAVSTRILSDNGVGREISAIGKKLHTQFSALIGYSVKIGF